MLLYRGLAIAMLIAAVMYGVTYVVLGAIGVISLIGGSVIIGTIWVMAATISENWQEIMRAIRIK
jgi:hypothetical protein